MKIEQKSFFFLFKKTLSGPGFHSAERVGVFGRSFALDHFIENKRTLVSDFVFAGKCNLSNCILAQC